MVNTAVLNSSDITTAGGVLSRMSLDSSWYHKNNVRTAVIVGDSTTDSNATGAAFFAQLAKHQTAGGLLEGVIFSDFGSNGLTLASWLAGGGATGKTKADLPTTLDAAGLRMGINDIRTGATSQDQLRDRYVAWIDYMSSMYSQATLWIEVPNSLTSDDYNSNGYVTTTGLFTGMTVAQAAQTATTWMRNAVYEAWKLRPFVLVLDAQDAIFGRTSRARLTVAGSNANVQPLMNDQLHPTDTANRIRANWYAEIFSIRAEQGFRHNDAELIRFNRMQAANAENFTNPYVLFPDACLDERFWTVTYLGRVGAAGTNYADVGHDIPFSYQVGYFAGQLCPGDIVLFGVSNAMDGGVAAVNNGGTLRFLPSAATWTAASRTQPVVGQPVYLCRSKYARASRAYQAAQNPANNFQRFGYVTSLAGDNSYIDVAAYPGAPTASTWDVTTADTLIASGDNFNAAMTGFTITTNGNNLRLTRPSGSFAGFNARPIAILGTR